MKKLFVFLFVMFTMTISAQDVKTHIVQRGETIESIAEKYNVSATDITKANPDAAKFFYTGMKLKIPAVSTKKPIKSQTVVTPPVSANTNQEPTKTVVNTNQKPTKTEVNTEQPLSHYYLRYIDASYSFGFFSPSEGDSQSFSAITVGMTASQNFNNIPPLYFFLKANAQYSFYSKKENGADVSFKMLSFNLTPGLAYAFEIPNSKVKIMPKAGLNLRFSIGGLQKTETTYGGITKSRKVNVFNEKDMGKDAMWNWFNFGGLIGVDAIFSDRYVLGASYQMDFTNIATKTSVNQINITLGYCF